METSTSIIMPRLFKAILLGFLVGIVGLVVSLFHFALKFEENTGLGLLFKLRNGGQVYGFYYGY